jgi:hypothetical protein
MEFLFELLFEVFGEILLEALMAGFKESRGRQNHGPVAATFGYLLLGAAIGGLSLWVMPRRLMSVGGVRGASIVLSPLFGGLALDLWGRYRRAQGHEPTRLATFYGGAAFLFAYAVVRFLGVGVNP